MTEGPAGELVSRISHDYLVASGRIQFKFDVRGIKELLRAYQRDPPPELGGPGWFRSLFKFLRRPPRIFASGKEMDEWINSLSCSVKGEVLTIGSRGPAIPWQSDAPFEIQPYAQETISIRSVSSTALKRVEIPGETHPRRAIFLVSLFGADRENPGYEAAIGHVLGIRNPWELQKAIEDVKRRPMFDPREAQERASFEAVQRASHDRRSQEAARRTGEQGAGPGPGVDQRGAAAATPPPPEPRQTGQPTAPLTAWTFADEPVQDPKRSSGGGAGAAGSHRTVSPAGEQAAPSQPPGPPPRVSDQTNAAGPPPTRRPPPAKAVSHRIFYQADLTTMPANIPNRRSLDERARPQLQTIPGQPEGAEEEAGPPGQGRGPLKPSAAKTSSIRRSELQQLPNGARNSRRNMEAMVADSYIPQAAAGGGNHALQPVDETMDRGSSDEEGSRGRGTPKPVGGSKFELLGPGRPGDARRRDDERTFFVAGLT